MLFLPRRSRRCQGQGDPNYTDAVVDVLLEKGFDGTKNNFLYIGFEGFARSAAKKVRIPFNRAATIERGLSIIAKRWYTRKVNSETLDPQRFFDFIYKNAPLEQQANNTSRLLVQFLRSGKLRSNSQMSNNDQNVDSFVTDVTEMLALRLPDC